MKKMVFILLIAALLIPTAVHAQTPEPPPSLASCLPWDFDGVKCWQAGGVWGFVIFLLLSVLVFILSDVGKQAWEALKAWWSRRPPSILTEVEKEQKRSRYRARLLDEFEEQKHKADWLNRLAKTEEILHPSDDQTFVDLSMDLQIELSRRNEEAKSYNPVESFSKIEEAVSFSDKTTGGKPYPALALIGEPGAGKSTLLRKLARHAVQEAQADLAKPWVLFVSLSDYTGGKARDFLRSYWEREVGYDGFSEALATGKIWLFLDGLNEVPRKLQDSAKAEWRLFLTDDEYFGKKGNRAVITSRTADYGDGVGVPRLEVKYMDEGQMQTFLQKRGAEGLWEELKKHRDHGSAVYDLAKIPFWLDKMALIFEKGKKLPENRFTLVEQLVERWLALEEKRDALQHPLTDNERGYFWDSLTRAAWKGMSSFGPNTPMPTQTVLRLLKNPALREEDALEIAKACGFLVKSDKNGLQVKFFHQLLQEYFAAREFARQFEKGKDLSKKWKIPWRRWEFVQSQWDPMPAPPTTGWEETIILAAGNLGKEQTQKLVLRILEHNSPLAARCVLEAEAPIGEETRQACGARLRRDMQNPRVRLPMRLAAGKALARLGDPRFVKQQTQMGETQAAFIAPEWRDIPEGKFNMGTSSLQEYLFKIQYRGATYFGDEKPAHQVFLSAFKMARYPVTVAEYRCFMEAGGYENDDYWQEEGALRWRNAPLPFEETYAYKSFQTLQKQKEQALQFLKGEVRAGRRSPQELEHFTFYLKQGAEKLTEQWRENENQKRSREGKVIRPYLWDSQKYTIDNQPVIGVSWYEACAYAAWMREVLRQKGLISEEELIRLPTEAEWEKAARGGTGRLYSWGSRWNPSYANTIEGRVMQPSSVGAYPKNVSFYRLEETAGNVWEWCLDWYNENEYTERYRKEVKDPCRKDGGDARVLRGGSWDGSRSEARCSSRYRRGPDDFGNGIGFRVVCSPSQAFMPEMRGVG